MRKFLESLSKGFDFGTSVGAACSHAIASEIAAEVRKHGCNAESLRCAAWYVKDEYPDATSKQFADAAIHLGITRKSAINRWNEAMNNLEQANG